MNPSVLIVNPPQAKACEPPPGILALAAHLRQKGVSTSLFDANLFVQEILLSKENLASCADALARRDLSGPTTTSARLAVKRGSRAFDALRRIETYQSPRHYRPAVDAVKNAFKAVSLSGNFTIDVSNLDIPGLSPLSSADLAGAADAPDQLPIYGQLKAAAGKMLALDPTLIGISMSYLSQAAPAFALAGILRCEGFDGSIVLGGGLVSSWVKSLKCDSPFFRIWDAVVVGPGERPLEALARNADLSVTPGILAPRLGVWNPPKQPDEAKACFAPETDGLPWDDYLSPGPILPVAASRSCYWNKCKYCPDPNQFSAGIIAPDFSKLVKSVNQAANRIGSPWVHFTDSAIHPGLLKVLASRREEENWKWYGFARPEKLFLNADFCRSLARGGCAMIQLGIETVSQHLLNFMGKGANAKDFGIMTKNLSQAGIRTYVYLLFGIPGETKEQAQATLDWAAERSEHITFLNMSILNMPRFSSEGSKFFIEEETAGRRDLSLYRNFEISEGWSRGNVRRKLAEAKSNEAIRKILSRTPPGFTSSHAAFAPLGNV